MENYSYKCSCGQPYNVKQEGDYPSKDEFTRDCPSCGRQLKYKACCMSTDWEFDMNFQQQKKEERLNKTMNKFLLETQSNK